jgi:hypothetical protein
MQNKSKRRWLDIQIILASLAVTFTVGLWNVFAKGNKPVSSPGSTQPPDPAFTFTVTPAPTATATLDPKAPLALPTVHMLLGGNMPVTPVVMASAPSNNDSGNQGGGGGGGSNSKPPPASKTSSSK